MSQCPLSSERHARLTISKTVMHWHHWDDGVATCRRFLHLFMSRVSTAKAGPRSRRLVMCPECILETRELTTGLQWSYMASPEVQSPAAAADVWLVQTRSLIFWQLMPRDVGSLLTDSHQPQAWSIVTTEKKTARKPAPCSGWHRPLDKYIDWVKINRTRVHPSSALWLIAKGSVDLFEQLTWLSTLQLSRRRIYFLSAAT